MLATLGLLSPASTHQTSAFPSLRVVTPPSSIHTPSSCATRFPVSPLSPTPYSEPPRSTLSKTSFFQDQRSIHRRGDASPSKDYVPLRPGSPMTDSLKDHGAGPRSAGPIAESGTRSSDLLKCRWPDCGWVEYSKKNLSWSQHFDSHFDSALPSEKKKDGRATCRWNPNKCTRRMCEKGWKRHIRNHEPRFFFFCQYCPQKYLTDQKLENHMKNAHRPVTGEGASGSGGRWQGVRDRGDVMMEDQMECK